MNAPQALKRAAAIGSRVMGLFLLALVISLLRSAPTEAATVSGLVSDAFGTPIPNATVSVVDASGTVVSTTTDAMGSYSLTGPNASGYALRVHGLRGSTGAFLPADFTWQQPLDLTNDSTANVAPMAASVTVTVVDNNGQTPAGPITTRFASSPGTTATFTGPGGVGFRYGTWAQDSANTNGSGQAVFIGFQNSLYDVSTLANTVDGYSATAYGISGSPYSIGTSNTTLSRTVTTNRKTVSGTVKSRRNGVDAPLPGVTMVVAAGSNSWSTTTDSLGNYSLTVAGVTGYTMYVQTSTAVDPQLPNGINAQFSLDMTANRTGNTIYIPTTSFAVFTYDTERRPIGGSASISVNASGNIGVPFTGAGQMAASFSYTQTSTGTGNYFHERWGIPVLTNNVSVSALGTNAYQNPMTATLAPSATYGGSVTVYFPFSVATPSLTSVAAGSSKPTLSFSGGATTNCKIYRNGAYLDSVTGTSYTDNSAVSNVNYYYQVTCLNSGNVESLKSNTARGIYTGI